MGRTLNEMLASRSVDSQQRIQEMANELLLEVRLQALREELEVSQVELASALGIVTVHREDVDNNSSGSG